MKHTQSDVFVAYKNEGETPLECLNRLKDEGFLPFNDKFTYAGRLDPMAEGLMIYLRGEAIKSKHEFLGLSKEYEVEILLGVSTDTGDILGMVSGTVLGDVVFDLKNVQNICESFVGDMEVPYPWFSSKTLQGKPLYEWAREFAEEDDEVSVKGEEGQEIFLRPMTKLSIQKIEFLDLSLMPVEVLHNNIVNRIAKVKGDFRQDKILNEWNEKVFADKIKKTKSLHKNEEIEYPIIKIKVKCASGSYMRTLAELIGDKLKVPALAYSIKRLGVGDYSL
jgi:tRNA pseudouridine55 synthase